MYWDVMRCDVLWSWSWSQRNQGELQLHGHLSARVRQNQPFLHSLLVTERYWEMEESEERGKTLNIIEQKNTDVDDVDDVDNVGDHTSPEIL